MHSCSVTDITTRDICEIRNDPAFSHSNYNQSTASKTRPSVISRRLDITSNNSIRCPLHKAGHTLNDCRGFRKRSLQDRQKFLRENRICFKCCESNEHKMVETTLDEFSCKMKLMLSISLVRSDATWI
jgi:hypothetical protein